MKHANGSFLSGHRTVSVARQTRYGGSRNGDRRKTSATVARWPFALSPSSPSPSGHGGSPEPPGKSGTTFDGRRRVVKKPRRVRSIIGASAVLAVAAGAVAFQLGTANADEPGASAPVSVQSRSLLDGGKQV